jgi:ATP-dependent helicase/nuclease subunit B
MYPWLADALSQGDTVITANRRLTRELRRVYNEQQLEAGRKAWSTPDIRFVGDWIQALYESCDSNASEPLRMSAQSSGVLWERCVREHLSESLPGFSGLVKQCKQSWARLQEWCVPLNEVAQRASSPEQRKFYNAAKLYCDLLSRHQSLDDAGLAHKVAEAARRESIDAPPRICLAGFDRLWPALTGLLDALRDAGTSVSLAEVPGRAANIAVISLDDRQTELRTAGAWARQQLLLNPAGRIAVVCPDLETDADGVARLVREGFAPGWQLAGPGHRGSVNVSYGQSLADFPSITVAMMLLRWVHDGLSSQEVSVLLRSRSIIGGPVPGRCRLEQQLRRLPDRLWRAEDLSGVLHNPGAGPDADAWHEAIRHIAEAEIRYRDKETPAEWAERINQLLSDVGWPGTEVQDSNEFQLLNRWRELLNEMARLERVLPLMTFREAVSRLISLASDTVFQAEAEPGVLPVLGTLEAAGMQFDKIWVTGLDDGRWPASGNPLPYVSRQLQKDHAMPDATPQDSLKFSSDVLQRLLCSADEVVLSWAEAENGVEQQPSPLLKNIPSESQPEFTDPGWHALSMLDSELLATADEDPIPPIGPDERISGGAYTVQRQATEPFAAFAYGRLRVGDLQPFQPGLSASIRGSAIHAALSHLYKDRPSHSEVTRWSEEEWAARIGKSSDAALVKYEWHADVGLRRMIQLERRRIRQILLQFSHAELDRDAFNIVMVEQKLEYFGFGVRLGLRVDRVDKLDDGGLLVIDYKTGAEKSLLDRDGNLRDLQLVVYTLAIPEAIGGVALINLDSRKISFKGAGAGEDWQERLHSWRNKAEQAIRGIAQGDARVNTALNTDEGRPLNVLSRFEELRRD